MKMTNVNKLSAACIAIGISAATLLAISEVAKADEVSCLENNPCDNVLGPYVLPGNCVTMFEGSYPYMVGCACQTEIVEAGGESGFLVLTNQNCINPYG